MQIKRLYLHIKKYNQQIQLLTGYKKEYISTLYETQRLGLNVFFWKNYHEFLFLLSELIFENKQKIKKKYEDVKKELNQWSKYTIKLKTWEYLNKKIRNI